MASSAALSRIATAADPLSTSDTTSKQYVDTLTRAAGVGTLRALRPAVSWGRDSATTTIQHTAFPSVVALRNATLYMVVRRGTDHSATRDGGIWYSTSTDQGRTWSAPVQLFAASGGLEYRDPCVSLSVDGTKLYLTYFKGSASLAAAGCFFRTSSDGGLTWSAEVRMEAKPYAAISAPVVELAAGRLVAPFYGKENLADTYDSVYVSTSTNGGTSWTPTRIFNGADVSLNLQEPWIVRKPGGANDLVMTFRYGTNDRIGQSATVQTDGLGWSAATPVFTGTGRPATVWLSTGELVVIYRDATNQQMLTRLGSNGWFPPTNVRRTPSGGFWTYGQPIEISAGTALTPFAEENAGNTPSKLYVTALSRGGGWSPLGLMPSDALAVATSYDTIDYVTTFRERASTTLGPEWTALAGSLVITADGYLSSAAADNSPDRAMVDVNRANVVLEADVYMTVQTGAAVLCRVVDAANFLMWTVETAGTTVRLYKVVAGVATQLVSAGANVGLGSWNTLRVEATDTVIRGYLNGLNLAGYVLTAGAEASTFTTPGKHGVGLNAQSGGVHYCRRFIAKGL